MAKQNLQVDDLLVRVFDEEIQKIDGIIPEFEAKQISLKEIKLALEDEKENAIVRLNAAINAGDNNECISTIFDSRDFALQIRVLIDHYSKKHLGKSYK